MKSHGWEKVFAKYVFDKALNQKCKELFYNSVREDSFKNGQKI